MAEFLVDTNVLSRIFTGDKNVKQFIETVDAAVWTVVYAECLQGSKSNREKQIVESYLSRFEFCHLTSRISQLEQSISFGRIRILTACYWLTHLLPQLASTAISRLSLTT